MRRDANLSLPGISQLVAQFLDRLDLRDITLVGNDTGGALVQLLACDDPARLGRIVLASCDAFDNFPPGLTGRTLVLTGKLPPGQFGLFMHHMRLRPVRRLPIAFGWLTKRGDATRRWIQPVLHQRAIRRDTVRALRAAAADKNVMLEAAGGLGAYPPPRAGGRANEDGVMPPDHGRCLTELLLQGRLVEIPDTYTLIPWISPDGSRGSCVTSHGHRPATGQHGSRHDERSRRSALPGGVPERTPAGTVRASPMCRSVSPGHAEKLWFGASFCARRRRWSCPASVAQEGGGGAAPQPLYWPEFVAPGTAHRRRGGSRCSSLCSHGTKFASRRFGWSATRHSPLRREGPD
jgi:pimeloyl-ACP methyl ester carboxylesterase